MVDFGAGPQPSQRDVDPETVETGPSLMLDPSLLLSMRALPVVMELARRHELRGAVIPRMVFEFMGETSLSEDVLRFFGGPARESEHGRVGDILPLIRELRQYQSRLAHAPEMAESGTLLDMERQVRSREVAEILGEEWAFLTTHSWIASRVKRPFSAFVKAGAFAIEGSRDSFDRLVAKTLKRPPWELPAGLSSRDKLRAISKWMAVGGMSALPLVLFPHIQVLVGGAFGYFLLFDL